MARQDETMRCDEQSLWPVHIEVRLTQKTSMSFESIERLVHQYLTDNFESLFMPSALTGWDTIPTLRNSVEKIIVSDSVNSRRSLRIDECLLQIHVYQPSENSTYERMAINPSDPNEEYTAGTMTELPSRELEGLWESLHYSGDVKLRLLNYIYATVGFSDADIDFNLVSWNRVILLYGPPGTGKTSLCRALAQKLSIRLKTRYAKTHLFEINSHSLFSRWFSESGKLVQNLFTTVGEMARDEEDFIVLLIDEVESLTAARAGVMSGSEPSDALRVVNALLTQIDRLKHQKNVLIMTTSNLAKAIDTAFVDRADFVQYIDYPPAEAIYEILRSCLIELMSKGIVAEQDVPSSESAILSHKLNNIQLDPITDKRDASRLIGSKLYSIAEKCKGMSGRTLRRLPVLAHARYIGLLPAQRARNSRDKQHAKKQVTEVDNNTPSTSVEIWLSAMQKVVDDEMESRDRFSS